MAAATYRGRPGEDHVFIRAYVGGVALAEAAAVIGRNGLSRKTAAVNKQRREAPATKHSSEGALLAGVERRRIVDRKSTRLNSSHVAISYAVFCLKKKKKTTTKNTNLIKSPNRS